MKYGMEVVEEKKKSNNTVDANYNRIIKPFENNMHIGSVFIQYWILLGFWKTSVKIYIYIYIEIKHPHFTL